APLANAIINIGAAVTFNGTATDAEQGNLASSIQWTSSLDGILGTGASVTAPRLRPGTHVITAKVTDAGGLVGQAQITINVGHAPTVAITAPLANSVFFTAQLPLTLTATATDVEDGNLNGLIRWAWSKDGNLGNGPSVVRSLTIGTHVITAAVTDSNGLIGQQQITIKVRGPNVAPVVTITVPTNNGSAPAGTNDQLTA